MIWYINHVQPSGIILLSFEDQISLNRIVSKVLLHQYSMHNKIIFLFCTQYHKSIVRNLRDLPIKAAGLEKNIIQKYTCVICPRSKFKPTSKNHVQSHYASHWKKRVNYKGKYVKYWCQFISLRWETVDYNGASLIKNIHISGHKFGNQLTSLTRKWFTYPNTCIQLYRYKLVGLKMEVSGNLGHHCIFQFYTT